MTPRDDHRIDLGDGAFALRLADVHPESVSWVWRGFIPIGKVTLLDGDPGLGKSTVTLDLAGRVSCAAPMPDGTPGIDGNVLVLTAEDGLEDTVRPRLDAAGADPERIHTLEIQRKASDGLGPLVLPADVPRLQRAITSLNAAVVIIDPLMAFLGPEVEIYNDQHVRRALAPLAAMARDTGAAVLSVRHLNKGAAGKALYRGMGSIGIVGAARSVLLAASDPDDPDRRVLAVVKSNLSTVSPSLSYRLESAENGVAKVDWLGPSHHRADQLLGEAATAPGSLQRAMEFLRQALSHERPAEEVQRVAQEEGHSARTIRRAAHELGVRASRGQFGGPVRWALAPVLPDSIVANTPTLGFLANMPEGG
jgi:RecA-family ATPase